MQRALIAFVSLGLLSCTEPLCASGVTKTGNTCDEGIVGGEFPTPEDGGRRPPRTDSGTRKGPDGGVSNDPSDEWEDDGSDDGLSSDDDVTLPGDGNGSPSNPSKPGDSPGNPGNPGNPSRDAGVDGLDAGKGVTDSGSNPGPCTPTREVCDRRDNDCDGLVDEGLTNACGGACADEPAFPPGAPCTNESLGECLRQGVYECRDGQTMCNAPLIAGGPEICDGKDNNCDGFVDEGNLCPGGGSCRAGRCQSSCGDGLPNSGEDCDDGNTNDNDSCRNNCTWRVYSECSANGQCRQGEACQTAVSVCGYACRDSFDCRSAGAGTMPICTPAGRCALYCSGAAGECPSGMVCNRAQSLCAWP